jgi:hypothetical protein
MEYFKAGDTHTASGGAWPDLPLVVPMANSPTRFAPCGVVMSMHRSEPRTTPILEAPRAVEHASPPMALPDLNADAGDAPLRFRHVSDIMGTTTHLDDGLLTQ